MFHVLNNYILIVNSIFFYLCFTIIVPLISILSDITLFSIFLLSDAILYFSILFYTTSFILYLHVYIEWVLIRVVMWFYA